MRVRTRSIGIRSRLAPSTIDVIHRFYRALGRARDAAARLARGLQCVLNPRYFRNSALKLPLRPTRSSPTPVFVKVTLITPVNSRRLQAPPRPRGCRSPGRAPPRNLGSRLVRPCALRKRPDVRPPAHSGFPGGGLESADGRCQTTGQGASRLELYTRPLEFSPAPTGRPFRVIEIFRYRVLA